MTPEERQRMHEICTQLATEKDLQTFDNLVNELDDILELKNERLNPDLKRVKSATHN